jgi:hypothetical protein
MLAEGRIPARYPGQDKETEGKLGRLACAHWQTVPRGGILLFHCLCLRLFPLRSTLLFAFLLLGGLVLLRGGDVLHEGVGLVLLKGLEAQDLAQHFPQDPGRLTQLIHLLICKQDSR